MKFKSTLIALACLLFGCEDKLPAPPITVPFDAHRKRSQVSIDFRVTEEKFIAFYLRFHFKNEEEREYLSKLVGHNRRHSRTHDIPDGIPLPIKLLLTQKNKKINDTILDEVIKDPEYISFSSDSFNQIISKVKLLPGNYSVIATALRTEPLFNNQDLRFSVSFSYTK